MVTAEKVDAKLATRTSCSTSMFFSQQLATQTRIIRGCVQEQKNFPSLNSILYAYI
jgi:hypothetical protein